MWIRLDDQITHHPKFTLAGPVASWLYIGGLAYAARFLTDGLIPVGSLHMLAGVPNPERYAQRLVLAGLWETCGDGWRIHDYHDYQPTREWVEERRELRRTSGRLGGRRSGEARSKRASKIEATCLANRQANGQAKSNPVPVPVPVPGSDRRSAPEGSARGVSCAATGGAIAPEAFSGVVRRA